MMPDKRPRTFASHAAIYAVGNIARRFVGFVMLPIYTRFLTPADYGVIGLLTVALALVETLLGARLSWAIPKFYFDVPDGRPRRTVIWSALGITAAASAVALVALFLFRGIGAEILFGNRKYALALGLFAIALVTQPIEQTGMTYLRLREHSGLFIVFSLAKLLVQLGLNVLLVVYWRDGVMGVVLSAVISSVLFAVGASVYVAYYEAPAFDWQVTRKMIQFCWPLWVSALAGLYIGTSGAMFLRMFATLSAVGLLELALRFSGALAMVLWAPFAQHWEPMSFQYYRQANGKQKFQVAFITISAMMFVGGLGISIFSEPVIKIMAAKSFYAAATVVPVLSFGVILDRLRSFFDFSFMVTSRTKLRSLYQYGAAVVITIAYVTLIPPFGLMGAAVAQCLAFAVTFVYVHKLSRRYYDPGIRLKPIAVFVLIGFVACLFVNAVPQISNLVIDLLIKSIVMLIASVLIGVVALRAIRAVDVSMLESLPWPLHKLGRMQLGRILGS